MVSINYGACDTKNIKILFVEYEGLTLCKKNTCVYKSKIQGNLINFLWYRDYELLHFKIGLVYTQINKYIHPRSCS